MRLLEFHVEGFGHLAHLSMTDVPPGLSVVLGANEAGKSTLLEFLRSILFGLPSRKQKEFYPPTRGGRKGGRLILRNEQSDRIIVERFEGKGNGLLTVTMPDGSQGGEAEFRQLIGSATDDLYRSVFAFSLSELQSFDSLKTEKVRNAIYSAGIGIGRLTITQVLQELTKQAGDLFVLGGSTKTMNQLLSRIEAHGRQIKSHEKDQDEYEGIQSEVAVCEVDLQRIGPELRGARLRANRLRILQQAREDWITLGACREQMQSLPMIETFPIDGVKRLDQLTTERNGVRDQITELTFQKERHVANLAAIKVEEVLLNAAKDIRRLDRSRELNEQSRQQLLTIQTERELAEQQLLGSLRDLGDEWDESMLGEFDLSIPVLEGVEACRRACEAASDTVRERRVQSQGAIQEQDDARRLENEARLQLAQLPQPSAAIDAEGIRKLQLGWERYDSARQDSPAIEKQCRTKLDHLLDTLRKIGPSWTEDRLKLFDTSLAVQEEVLAHQTRLGDVRSDQQEADRVRSA